VLHTGLRKADGKATEGQQGQLGTPCLSASRVCAVLCSWLTLLLPLPLLLLLLRRQRLPCGCEQAGTPSQQLHSQVHGCS